MLIAMPRPDGNSFVEASIETGHAYSLQVDHDPRPLILIGTQVYGLHETPFLDETPCSDSAGGAGVTCKYHFVASTNVLRNAQSFEIADLSWENFMASGHIEFMPSLTSLSVLGTAAKADPTPKTADAPAPAAKPCVKSPLKQCAKPTTKPAAR